MSVTRYIKLGFARFDIAESCPWSRFLIMAFLATIANVLLVVLFSIGAIGFMHTLFGVPSVTLSNGFYFSFVIFWFYGIYKILKDKD